VLFGGLIAALLMLAIDFCVLNFAPPVDFSRFHILHNNARLTAVWIAAVWLFIAPSEELISGAFLIDQWQAVFTGKSWASIAAVVLSSVGFGLVHFYEGTTGILSNANKSRRVRIWAQTAFAISAADVRVTRQRLWAWLVNAI